MQEFILFSASLFSFAAALISFLFFLRFKKQFFVHAVFITVAFFLICANSFYAQLHGVIGGRTFICVFGGFLSLLFSYGITGFALDFYSDKCTGQNPENSCILFCCSICFFNSAYLYSGHSETFVCTEYFGNLDSSLCCSNDWNCFFQAD